MSSLTPWAVSSVVSSEGALIFFFYTATAAQTNTPRLAAGMAPFQPRDWFSNLSLSLAIRVVCQKMDECNLSTTFHISIKEKFFLDSYGYCLIAQPYLTPSLTRCYITPEHIKVHQNHQRPKILTFKTRPY